MGKGAHSKKSWQKRRTAKNQARLRAKKAPGFGKFGWPQIKCPSCRGGWSRYDCTKCKGSGKIPRPPRPDGAEKVIRKKVKKQHVRLVPCPTCVLGGVHPRHCRCTICRGDWCRTCDNKRRVPAPSKYKVCPKCGGAKPAKLSCTKCNHTGVVRKNKHKQKVGSGFGKQVERDRPIGSRLNRERNPASRKWI